MSCSGLLPNQGAAFAEARLGEAAHSSHRKHDFECCSRVIRFGFEPSEKGLKEMMRAVQAALALVALFSNSEHLRLALLGLSCIQIVQTVEGLHTWAEGGRESQEVQCVSVAELPKVCNGVRWCVPPGPLMRRQSRSTGRLVPSEEYSVVLWQITVAQVMYDTLTLPDDRAIRPQLEASCRNCTQTRQ